jgi:hypothetical protein
MKKNKFREEQPQRTYKGKTLSNYRDYKPFLRSDFNKRCGYTDSPDYWFGGKNNFHVDHFIPWTKPPYLKLEYSNLVYVSSHVNIAKSDDEGLFLDPCEVDYNDHFWRNEAGEIICNPESKSARYMYHKLKLYLARYGIIWILDNIVRRMDILAAEISKVEDSEIKNELLILQGHLGNKFVKFRKYHVEVQ